MNRNVRLAFAPMAAAIMLGLAAGSSRAADDFTDIPLPPGITGITPLGVSGDGSTVVGTQQGEDGVHAFVWTSEDGMSILPFLDPLPSPASSFHYAHATATSFNGRVVVGTVYAGVPRGVEAAAFRWTQAEGVVSLGFLDGGDTSVASSVSADGSVIVGYANSGANLSLGAFQAFRWTAGSGMVGLGTLAANHDASFAEDVSGDGSTIVGSSGCSTCNMGSSGPNQAFRWTQETGMVGIGFLDGGNNSIARATSSDGSVIVGWSDTAASNLAEAFRWTAEGGMVGLGKLGEDIESWANEVSADGSVVVGYSRGNRGDANEYIWADQAFRWTEEDGLQYLGDWLAGAGIALPEGYILSQATGINADGTVVVGYSESPGIPNRGWIARVGYTGSGLITDLDAFMGGLAQSGISALRAGADLSNLALSAQQWRSLGSDAGDDAACLHATANAAHYRDSGTHAESLEIGGCRSFGLLRLGLGLGTAQARQDTGVHSDSDYRGQYFTAQAAAMLGGKLEAGISAYSGRFDSDIHRRYGNGGTLDTSIGQPDMESTGAQLTLAWRSAGAGTGRFVPFVAYRWSSARVDAYTETGGGFPAAYRESEWDSREVRAGVAGAFAMSPATTLRYAIEGVHRLDDTTGAVGGEVVDLFDFGHAGQQLDSDWMHASAGVDWWIGSRSVLGFEVGGATDGAGDPSISGSLTYRVAL